MQRSGRLDTCPHHPPYCTAWHKAVHEGQELVESTDDLNHASVVKRPQSGLHDLLCGQAGEFPQQLLVVSKYVNLGFDCAGTKRQKPHACSSEFFGESFGERKDKGLCGGVHGEMREGLEADDRSQVDDGATPAANHASENPVGQSYNCFGVQPYLSDLLGERRLEKVAGGGNTGVVD